MFNLGHKLKKSRYMQYLAVATAEVVGICSLMMGSWGSPAIAKLTSPNSPIGVILDSDEASWVASSPLLGYIVGTLLAPILLIKLGPKRSLILATAPIAISWLGIAFSTSVTALITLRFVMGVGNGSNITILSLYVGEIADKDIRGRLCTWGHGLSSIGNLIVLSIGPFVTYRTLTLICAVVPIVFILVFPFLPESPYYLMRSGQVDESRRNLRRLLSIDVDEATLDERIKEIELTVKSELRNKYNVLYIFSKKHFRFALFICFNLKLIMAFGGLTVLKSYLQTIIGSTASTISPELSSVIFAIVQQPTILIAGFLMDKVGRKPLLIISTLGCTISLGLEGLYFYLQDVVGMDLGVISWLPTLCLAVHIIMEPLGLSPVSNIMVSEILADDIKSFSAGILTTFRGVCLFMLSKYFLPVAEAWGMYTTFWIFGVMCLYGALFGIFILPETKGKSFLEIQEMLKSRYAE